MKKPYKVQSTVEEYTYFVINGLVNIKGTSASDVVSYIIRSWIDNNDKLLQGMGLSVEDWKRLKEK